jgi:hypothetical protein
MLLILFFSVCFTHSSVEAPASSSGSHIPLAREREHEDVSAVCSRGLVCGPVDYHPAVHKLFLKRSWPIPCHMASQLVSSNTKERRMSLAGRSITLCAEHRLTQQRYFGTRCCQHTFLTVCLCYYDYGTCKYRQ